MFLEELFELLFEFEAFEEVLGGKRGLKSLVMIKTIKLMLDAQSHKLRVRK